MFRLFPISHAGCSGCFRPATQAVQTVSDQPRRLFRLFPISHAGCLDCFRSATQAVQAVSDQPRRLYCFEGNFGETVERRGKARTGLAERSYALSSKNGKLQADHFFFAVTAQRTSNRSSASLRHVCLGSFTCCHTETEAANQTCYTTLSQYTDTGSTSPNTDVQNARRVTGQPLELLFQSLGYDSVRDRTWVFRSRTDIVLHRGGHD